LDQEFTANDQDEAHQRGRATQRNQHGHPDPCQPDAQPSVVDMVLDSDRRVSTCLHDRTGRRRVPLLRRDRTTGAVVTAVTGGIGPAVVLVPQTLPHGAFPLHARAGV
jgi:hypothetical protein